MKINRTKLFYVSSLFIILFILKLDINHAKLKDFNWINISGKWEIRKDNKESYLIENKATTRSWNKNELTNFNSIITTKRINALTSIQLRIEILNPITNPIENMIFFSAKTLKNFYAFKFIGNNKRIHQILFIKSKIKDTTKGLSEKWNYEITKLESIDYELDYNKEHYIEIKIKKREATLIINREDVLKVRAKVKLNEGRFGFSSRNSMVKIDDVKVYRDKSIVFQDDFTFDNIKRYKVSAKRVKNDHTK